MQDFWPLRELAGVRSAVCCVACLPTGSVWETPIRRLTVVFSADLILRIAPALARLQCMASPTGEAQEADLAGGLDPAQEFLALLDPVKVSLERYALRSAWNKDQAADIVQQAVMTAWREFHKFRTGTCFKAWVFRILINTIFSFNKKVSRDRKNKTALPIEHLEGVLERESAWASILEEPEKILESLDDRLILAIAELSLGEQQCLLLKLLEGLTYKEIASYLSIPIGTVMSHVHRARLKLREQLADLAIEQRLVREV